eukprot:m.220582 g.220582  ORF g.220582 m.220582 type:complete len:291 (-) comp19167_c2_seq8:2214-3086(-)
MAMKGKKIGGGPGVAGKNKGKKKSRNFVVGKKSHWAQRAGLGKSASKSFKRLPERATATESDEPGNDKKQKRKVPHTIVPYKEGQRILLVGEGNFSFAASLCTMCDGNGSGIVATGYDSRDVAHAKYDDAQANIETVEGSGGSVFFGIDAEFLDKYKELTSDGPYDVLVFNFPHCGMGIKDKLKNVRVNQKLIQDFLLAGKQMIHNEGELHITVKRGEPYDSWAVPKLGAQTPGLRLKNSFPFLPSKYPGYAHRRTLGFQEGISTDGNKDILKSGCKTYVFDFEKPKHKP